METKATMEPSGSPASGVIPEPIPVHHEGAPADEGRIPAPKSSAATGPATSPRRRNLASIVLARLLSALRGDKYLADAYRPIRRPSAAARVEDDAAPATSQTKKR